MFTVINCVNFPQHSFFICQSWYWKNSYCMCFCWISLRFEIDSYYYWKKCWKNSLDFDDWSDFCLFIIALCLSWKNYLFLKKQHQKVVINQKTMFNSTKNYLVFKFFNQCFKVLLFFCSFAKQFFLLLHHTIKRTHFKEIWVVKDNCNDFLKLWRLLGFLL